MAKCRSSTPVRNKEQKIDRLLSFMFLRRRDSSVCPSVSTLVFLLPLPSPPCSSRRRHISLLLFLPPRRTIRRIEEILLDALWEKNQGVRRKTRKRPRGRKRARSERKGRKGREAREERTRHVYAKKRARVRVRGNRTGLHSSSATDHPGFLAGNRIQLSRVRSSPSGRGERRRRRRGL